MDACDKASSEGANRAIPLRGPEFFIVKRKETEQSRLRWTMI